MKQKTQITAKEIAKMLNLSDAVVRVHLCCLDKYKLPFLRPATYNYSYDFLVSLRNFYQERSESTSIKYKNYTKIVEKIDKIIKMRKKIRTSLN